MNPSPSLALVPQADVSAAVAAGQTVASVDAERAFLGCVLYDNSVLTMVGGTLLADHFIEPAHIAVFEKIQSLTQRGQRADVITVCELLGEDEAFQKIGGMGYLAEVYDHAPPSRNAPDYARVILDCAIRRNLFTLCEETAHALLKDRDVSAFEVASSLRTKLEHVESAAASEDASMISAPDAAANALETMRELSVTGKQRGRMTGLRCVDRRLGGLKPGALIVVGGRPGMAKTGLARAIAHGAAVRSPDHLFPFLGIEMGPEEMMQRELSALSHELGEGVEYRAMGSGALTPMDFQNLHAASQKVPANLILDDCHALTLEDVRRKVWSLNRRGTVGAVFIDYLQIMRRPAANGRNETSVLGEITAGLKQIARQAECCVVLLSQLSRQVESRDDKRPQLSDLRESGSIEQDADAVLFPYREFYYVERAEPTPGSNAHHDWEVKCEDLRRRLDVICAKQRQGPAGTDRQRYFAEFDFIDDDREAGQ